MSAEQLDPINPLPGEEGTAYQAYCHYRKLVGKRSVLRAYRSYSGKNEAKYAPGDWNKWPNEFHWKERVAIWDGMQEQAGATVQLEAIKESAPTWAARLQQSQQATWDDAQRLRRLFETRIKMLETSPKKINSFELESLIRSATGLGSLERLACGLLNDRPMTNAEQEELRKLAALSPDELKRRREATERRVVALGVIQGGKSQVDQAEAKS